MPPYFDIDLESLRQLAGTIWLIVIGLLVLVVTMLTVLLPIFIWRIWWWTRAIGRETARLNEQMEHLLKWLIMVHRESPAPKESTGEETFAFQPLADQDGREVPAGAGTGGEEEGPTPAPEEAPSMPACPYCATPLAPDPESGGFPRSCPACYSPLNGA